MRKKVKNPGTLPAALDILGHPRLWGAALRCIASINKNFFLLQYRAALFPGRIPVSRVDHPLDAAIPFRPELVRTYHDFSPFWIRAAGFILREYGRKALDPVRLFLLSLGNLYAFAAQVYSKNLSTTERPRFLGSPGFLLIHAFDPHLMCIPSLHVMVVIRTWTWFRHVLSDFGDRERRASFQEDLHRGALAITEAVLFVKQHSVNCIAAALYAMTRFEERLFPPSEAEDFALSLFRDETLTGEFPGDRIRGYILDLYRRFLAEGKDSASWETPLLAFLQRAQKVC
jgi:hypothetical protein